MRDTQRRPKGSQSDATHRRWFHGLLMSSTAAMSPAIISASLNADVPAQHGAWFMRRIDAGYCRIGRRDGIHFRKVSLARDAVAGFVFWTRDAAPFLPCFAALRARGYASVVQFAVTGYPSAADPARIGTSSAIDSFRAVAGILGERAVVWRYDPIVVDASMPLAWHVDHFSAIAAQVRGLTDEVVIAFAREPKRAPTTAGVAPMRDDERRGLVRSLASSARACGMRLTLCSQPDWLAPGARC